MKLEGVKAITFEILDTSDTDTPADTEPEERDLDAHTQRADDGIPSFGFTPWSNHRDDWWADE